MENQNLILDSENFRVESNIEEQNIISLEKFIILSLVTFGLYQVWWTYKAWRFFQQKEKLDIMPAARAIFSIFYLCSLFNKILEFAKVKGYSGSYNSVMLFIGFIIANLSSKLPDPFWLISFVGLIFFIPPFKALNYAKQNSTDFVVNEYQSFSGRQIALLVFGIIFWVLVLIGFNAE